MALEMKIGDVLITSAFLALIIAVFTGWFGAMDSSLGEVTISSDLQSLEDSTNEDYKDLESGLQGLTTENTGFVVQENIFIDERGTGEADFSKEKSQSGFKNFVTNVFKNNKNGGFIDSSIKAFAISYIVLVVLILGLRSILGNGRW